MDVAVFVCINREFRCSTSNCTTPIFSSCRTWHEDNGKASLNSEGLPNNGIDYYISPQTISETMDGNPNKPYMVSISGKNLADNLEMLKKISSRLRVVQ